MSYFEAKTLPVGRQMYYEIGYRGGSCMSEYLSLTKPFTVKGFKLIMSDVHGSAEYLRVYIQQSFLSFDYLLYSSPALNGANMSMLEVHLSGEVILHTYDKLFFSMIASANINWNFVVSGWSVLE